MSYVHDCFNSCSFTFVSELVRRQKPRYEIPFCVHRIAQLRDSYITQREPYVRFRWIDAFDDRGAHYLRSHVFMSSLDGTNEAGKDDAIEIPEDGSSGTALLSAPRSFRRILAFD